MEDRLGISSADMVKQARLRLTGRMEHWKAEACQRGIQRESSPQRAVSGIRATMRNEQPIKPEDPFILRDATTLLIDCGLRPDECFRHRWEDVQDGAVHVPFGKTESAADNPIGAANGSFPGSVAGGGEDGMGISGVHP